MRCNNNNNPNDISKMPLIYTNSIPKDDKYGGIMNKNQLGSKKCLIPTFT